MSLLLPCNKILANVGMRSLGIKVSVSGFNWGIFLDLLHIRCKDWLPDSVRCSNRNYINCVKSVHVLVCIFPHLDWISIPPCSVPIRENADQNKSEYGHFSRSDHYTLWTASTIQNELLQKLSKFMLERISGWCSSKLIRWSHHGKKHLVLVEQNRSLSLWLNYTVNGRREKLCEFF